MKKFNLILIFISICFNIYAQDVEIFRSIKFCDNVPFFENPDWEGPTPGIKSFFIDKDDNCYVFIRKSNSWIKISADTQEQEVKTISAMDSTTPFWTYSNNEFLYGIYNYGYKAESFTFFRTSTDKTDKYEGKGKPLLNNSNYSTLFIDNYWFIADSNNRLIMFDFNKTDNEFSNVEQTENKVNTGNLEKYDLFIDKRNNGKYGPLRIGNHYLSNMDKIFNFYNLRESKQKRNKSSSIDIRESGYQNLGIDDNGLFYFVKYTSEKADPESGRAVYTGKEIQYSIAVEDIWTKEVYIYDYEKSLWNPPRIGGGATGEFNGSYPWFLSPDGYIYYVDGDVSKQEYQIKRINKIWYDDINISARQLGNINCNKIELVTDINDKTPTNVYCYKTDLIWELEKKGDWSKIKMLTGDEGWILSKYIDYKANIKSNQSIHQVKTSLSKATLLNVAVNKTMSVKENLRLRKEEATTSEVITTMQKGTKVKILKLGKAETIDGISSNWVQIEVQSGGKDRDGKEIKSGTVGWCYGGYLE